MRAQDLLVVGFDQFERVRQRAVRAAFLSQARVERGCAADPPGMRWIQAQHLRQA